MRMKSKKRQLVAKKSDNLDIHINANAAPLNRVVFIISFCNDHRLKRHTSDIRATINGADNYIHIHTYSYLNRGEIGKKNFVHVFLANERHVTWTD